MAIDSFSGKYRFLSNFYSIDVGYEGVIYPSVEHAYQAAKTLNVGLRSAIRMAGNPGAAKKMGQAVLLRPEWEDVKVEIMAELLARKFAHPGLRASLLATGDEELIEGNTWGDTVWGVCNGVGTNYLGRLLMDLRATLRPGANLNLFPDVEDLI
jgi:ribA/ribD-fused uncharacterized protein